MKKNGKLIGAAVAVIVLAVVFAGIWRAARPAVSEGTKSISIEVIHKDESAKTFSYQTDAEYLGEALLEEGLIQGDEGPYGLYIVAVDGETASYEEDNAYWALYEGDDYASQGIDLTPVYDGDAFKLVYTVG